MKIYPKDPKKTLSNKCPACAAGPGVYCGLLNGSGAVHERREKLVVSELTPKVEPLKIPGSIIAKGSISISDQPAKFVIEGPLSDVALRLIQIIVKLDKEGTL